MIHGQPLPICSLDVCVQVWVESFERRNLHFEVKSMRKATGYKTALAGLIRKRLSEGALEPTLIYAHTTKRVDEIVAWINSCVPGLSKGVAVAGAYHSNLSIQARTDAHGSFLRDEHQIMVATVAYGESCSQVGGLPSDVALSFCVLPVVSKLRV